MTQLTLTGADGLEIAAREWPGDADRSVLAIHATGFCKEVWEPVAAALGAADVRVLAIDQRGHGASGRPPSADWWGLGRDAAAIAARHGPFTVGLGHSSGATAATMAALLESAAVARLVLIEPVVFPAGSGYDESLSAQARLRRRLFRDRAEARHHFEGRGIFAGWVEAALEGYLTGGLRPSDDGWELACDPELEAQFYELGNSNGVWERLGELTLPVRLLLGARSAYHQGAFAQELARRYRTMPEVVSETDHFLPMQRPETVVTTVLEELG